MRVRTVIRVFMNNWLLSATVMVMNLMAILSLMQGLYYHALSALALAFFLFAAHYLTNQCRYLFVALSHAMDEFERIKHVNETTKAAYSQTVIDVNKILEGSDET